MTDFKNDIPNRDIPPKRPKGKVDAPRLFVQLGILVLDGSGSMSFNGNTGITKAQEVNQATVELFTRFKNSRVKKNFCFSVVTFDQQAKVHTDITDATQIDNTPGRYDPTIGHNGGTDIGNALILAAQQATKFLKEAPKDGVPHSVVILVMSDGLCHNPERTLQIAEKLKGHSQVKVATSFFTTIGESDQGGVQLMKQISSDPVLLYQTTYNAEDLRKFFEHSISTTSGTNVN